MAKEWDKESTTYLKRYAVTRTLSELAERYETDEEDVDKHLQSMKLTTKDGRGYQAPFVDPSISDFEAGLKDFHAGKWAPAKKKFEAVLEVCEQMELSARARQLARSCDEKLEKAGGGPDDAYLQAVMAKNEGDLEGAMEICSAGGRSSKDERFAYLAASLVALEGEPEEAMAQLMKAIELNPTNRIHAYHDSDFDALREVEAFTDLFETEAEAEAEAEVLAE